MPRMRCLFPRLQVVAVQMPLVHPGEPRKGNARGGVWAPEPVHARRCITERIQLGNELGNSTVLE